MNLKITTATAAAFLALAATPALAQQGTTLANPAQGQKSYGSASITPSTESSAKSGAMMKSGGAMSGTSGDTTGGKSTATGGNVGGAADRN